MIVTHRQVADFKCNPGVMYLCNNSSLLFLIGPSHVLPISIPHVVIYIWSMKFRLDHIHHNCFDSFKSCTMSISSTSYETINHIIVFYPQLVESAMFEVMELLVCGGREFIKWLEIRSTREWDLLELWKWGILHGSDSMNYNWFHCGIYTSRRTKGEIMQKMSDFLSWRHLM